MFDGEAVMRITWLTLDLEQITGEERVFSFEYISDKRSHQISFYFPTFVLSAKARIE